MVDGEVDAAKRPFGRCSRSKYSVSVIAIDSRWVPARICGLLAQRNIELRSIEMAAPDQGGFWRIQLVVTLSEPADAGLLVRRLTRLIDVVEVVDLAEIQA
jgi:acetolactate synthase small subunit